MMNRYLKLLSSTLFLLCIMISSFVHAETVELLQKNASVAYEKMMEAKQAAENSTKDAAFAEKKLASAKQKMVEAEHEAEAARKKTEQAKVLMQQAVDRWKQASDLLANEWGKSEIK